MIRINLLPYRELRKLEHRRRFQNLLALTLAAGVLVLAAGYFVQARALQQQEARNQRLDSAINEMSAKLGKIESLRQQRAALLARKELASQLQNGRLEAVLLFDELIRTLPEGVYLKDFKQSGDNATLTGYALSGARVSNYMGMLAAAETFDDPILIEVKAANQGNLRTSEFSLTVNMRHRNASAPTQEAKP